MSTDKALRVAIQGERGAFSHQAALGVLGAGIEVVAEATFDDLFASVRRGAGGPGPGADRELPPRVDPRELRSAAPQPPAHRGGDAAADPAVPDRPARHRRWTRSECVASHPVALAQCRRFFSERSDVEAVTAYDTAGAVRDLMKGRLAGRRCHRLDAGGRALRGRGAAARASRTTPRTTRASWSSPRSRGRSRRRTRRRSCSCWRTSPGCSTAPWASSRTGASTCASSSRGRCGGTPGSTRSTSTRWAIRGGGWGRRWRSCAGVSREFRILGYYPEGLRGNGVVAATIGCGASP